MTGEIMAYTFAHLMLLDLQAAASRISCPFSFTVNYCLDAGNSGNKVWVGANKKRQHWPIKACKQFQISKLFEMQPSWQQRKRGNQINPKATRP